MRQDIILEKAKKYAHNSYSLSRQFPKEEQFGLTSQLRRASISIPLNIVEGYARQSRKSEAQFLTIAFGSLKESQFILQFAIEEEYISRLSAQETLDLGEEVARLLWTKKRILQTNE